MNAETREVLPFATERDAGDERMPPHNVAAEQALLGAIFINNGAYGRVAEFLLPEHFGTAVHGRIFAAIARLVDSGRVANPVTLKALFDQDGALAEIGGARYLAKLADSAVTIINAEDYGRRIHELHLRRALIAIGEDVVNDALRQDLDDLAPQQIERAEARLFELASTGQEGGFVPFERALATAIRQAEAAFQRDGATVGVATGFIDLDTLLGGLHPSDLVILAGRPSMGKTALATNIAFNAARAGKSCGLFSLEMAAEQLATRILAEEAGIGSDRIRRGDVKREHFEVFLAAQARLAGLPLHLDDTPALSVAQLRTRARRLKRQRGLHLIVVDYLQLLRAGGARDAENRVQEVSQITRGLKALAKELDVPVLALSQLSRAVELREDKRPMLSDLRESGTIEQDADVVMFVFREEYYLARAQPGRRPSESDDKFNDRCERWQGELERAANIGEIILAKQRHGPIGTVELRFDAVTTRFSDLERRHAEFGR